MGSCVSLGVPARARAAVTARIPGGTATDAPLVVSDHDTLGAAPRDQRHGVAHAVHDIASGMSDRVSMPRHAA
jgi:hypothetical protein